MIEKRDKQIDRVNRDTQERFATVIVRRAEAAMKEQVEFTKEKDDEALLFPVTQSAEDSLRT
jgi:hypothetical protein